MGETAQTRQSSAAVVSRRRPHQRTILRCRATKYLFGTLDGEHVRLSYHVDTERALANLQALHGLKNPLLLHELINALPESNLPVSQVTIMRAAKGCITVESEIIIEDATATVKPLGRITFLKLTRPNIHYCLVRDIKRMQKCAHCGTFYVLKHVCNTLKAQYYYMRISARSRDWWNKIRFIPVGDLPDVKRVIITYDIETYTKHGNYGKQLVPYLLVMSISGHEKLCRDAERQAKRCGFSRRRGCFYILHRDSNRIGSAFRAFRRHLQLALVQRWVRTFQRTHGVHVESKQDIEKLVEDKALRLDISPLNFEVVIIGHNIAGFDEIVMAAHTLDSGFRDDVERWFDFNRIFMPRTGKILFNDIYLTVPNHTYKKPDRLDVGRRQRGILKASDKSTQGIVLKVRDSFLLTHTALRTAASAYALPVSKGVCPYTAVNEYLMTGQYEYDEKYREARYPHRRYWANDKEFHENLPKDGKTYDIIEASLEYCIDDVIVTQALVEKLVDSYNDFCKNDLGLDCEFNILQRPTISSNTHALFRQTLYMEHGQDDFVPLLYSPSERMYDHVRASVRGGRCYPTFIGMLDEPIYVYDICGMYASALTHPMPAGMPLDTLQSGIAIRQFQDILNSRETISYFDKRIKPMIVVVDAFPPPNEMLDVLPPLCSRKGGRLCWTNEILHGEVLTSLDIITLHNRGWRCYIHGDEMAAVWPLFQPICKRYVELNIKAKEQADKDKNMTKRSISKLLSNALYGSFATRLDNRRVVFGEDMTEQDERDLMEGRAEIIASTTVLNQTMLSKKLPGYMLNSAHNTSHRHSAGRENLPGSSTARHDAPNVARLIATPFIHEDDHVIGNIHFVDHDCEELILHTIEDKTEWIENSRYPTQIASFVLAWTRAFTSEWANILFSDDYGRSLEDRSLKAVYGDTDSLFLTELGHRAMLERGTHRIKATCRGLVFDENDPQLMWAVECETVCKSCGSDAFSSQSMFIAPKLYALKDTTCPKCGAVGSGKLRAKGHAKQDMTYQLMKKCYDDYIAETNVTHKTRRLSMKRTILASNSKQVPFTVTEAKLERTLRPWQDRTMREGPFYSGGSLLYPYDRKHPNPRLLDALTTNPFWDVSSDHASPGEMM